MTNLTSKLIRSSRYIVLSAGFLFQAHSLFAAEPGDTHVQVRAFLNPPIVSNVKSVDSVAAGYSDAGEQVRAVSYTHLDVYKRQPSYDGRSSTATKGSLAAP